MCPFREVSKLFHSYVRLCHLAHSVTDFQCNKHIRQLHGSGGPKVVSAVLPNCWQPKDDLPRLTRVNAMVSLFQLLAHSQGHIHSLRPKRRQLLSSTPTDLFLQGMAAATNFMSSQRQQSSGSLSQRPVSHSPKSIGWGGVGGLLPPGLTLL